jgi:hypothetical protein
MDSNIVHVPTPYNSPFQRETCMHLSSAFLPPMHQILWLGLVHDRPHFLANFSTVRSILDFHSPFILFFLYNTRALHPNLMHSYCFPKNNFPHFTPTDLHCAKTTLLNKPLPSTSVLGSFQASITSLRPLSSQSAIFCISSPSDLEQEIDRYVFFLSFFLQWLLLLITDLNVPFLGQCVLSILRLI